MASPSLFFCLTKKTTLLDSTRVSNELGAGNPERGRQAMFVTLQLSVLLGLTVVLLLAFGHNIWAGFFSDSPVIIQAFASMTPLLTISILADSVQGVLSGSHSRSRSRSSLQIPFFVLHVVTEMYCKTAGVARGCGWQHMVVFVNLSTFYLVGISTAVFLEFRMKLYAKVMKISNYFRTQNSLHMNK